MDGGPGFLAEVVFHSLAECGRWYPPRPPWGDPHAYLASVCVEGIGPVLVRVVDGPHLAPDQPGRFVFATTPPWDDTSLQLGVGFRVLEPAFGGFTGRGRVLQRFDRTPIPPHDRGPEVGPGPDGWYGPPRVVRIARDCGRFPNVGRLTDGTQFVAYVVTTFPSRYVLKPDTWLRTKRVQAVVHFFAPDGWHLRTDVRLGGVEADGDASHKAFGHLNAIHDELVTACGGAEPEYGDVWVRLFDIELHGIRYALRYERHLYDPADADGADGLGYESVVFDPLGVMFHPPCTSGSYDT